MLTTCFFQHNERQHAHSEKGRVRIIEEVASDSRVEEPLTDEHFGLLFHTSQSVPSVLCQDHDQSSGGNLDITKSTYSEILQHFQASLIRIMYMPSD